MFIIGITGGIATGKSTVSRMFAQLGAKVVDADRIVHALLKPKGKCVARIKKIFGPDVILGGGVNRRALAEIVFNDAVKLRKLESILHPLVRSMIKMQLKGLRNKGYKGVVVLDVPLLFESEMDRDVDMTIVVKTSRDIQIQRAIKNLNLTKKEVLSRIKLQMPVKEKIRLADVVIDNSKSKIETNKKVKQIWLKVQRKPIR
ncbi:MAG: dephospho-CoA kinase [Candidatus Omnitrophota bacterium]